MLVFSHLSTTKPSEILKEHKKLVEKYLQKIIREKEINLDRILGSFKLKDLDFAKKLFFDGVISHDEGKKNPAFQYLKMKNEAFKEAYEKMDIKSTRHSFLGAKLFFKKYIDEVLNEDDDNEYYKKLFLLVSLSFIIAKHHSDINGFDEFVDKLKSGLKEENFKYADFDLEYGYFDIETFVAVKILYSLLISADYYATLEYMSDLEVSDFGSIDIKEVVKEFEEYEIIQNIRDNRYFKEIDKLRSEMFLEAESNLDETKNIFYLQAPTCAGKTLISLNLALRLNPKKIFYIFPFNTLVEQTKTKIEEIF